MKRRIFLIAIAALLQSCALLTLPAATDYGVSINISNQPAWGPTGYDYAAYYYLPDINIYYDVNRSLFYYQSGSRWVSAQYLPPSYRSYDLYSLYKVVINYDSPWQYNRTHRTMYSKYRNDRSQANRRSVQSSSQSNARPWVDPDRSNNKNSTYKKSSQTQLPSTGSQYRTTTGSQSGNSSSAGGAYRTGTSTQKSGSGSTGSSTSSGVSSRSSQQSTRSTGTTSSSSGSSSTGTGSTDSYSRGR